MIMEKRRDGMREDAFYSAALLSASGISPAIARRLIARLGSAAAAWQASGEDLAPVLSDAPRQALLALRQKKPELPEEIAAACGAKGIAVCAMEDETYPALLREIFQPPLVLFYRGTLAPEAPRLAMVGARRASTYGKHVAEEIASDLARDGVTVVSGAARGIDTASHRGALRTGRTVAVLGCGLDIVYPPENGRLLADIAEQGAVISEYPPGTRPLAAFFPARNRIISGLSRGTIVVEAAEKSGSLITAELALSEGRDVFAVPGSIYSETSRGCHRLIQQGAKLVVDAADVLAEYEIEQVDRAAEKKRRVAGPGDLSPEEQAVYDVLAFDVGLTVDEIIYRLHGRSEVSNVAFLLLQMELAGWVEADENRAYSRAVKEGNR